MLHNQTPLEIYIRAYVRQHKRQNIDQSLLRKGLARISEAITSSCCSEPSAVVNLHTPKESSFTLTVSALLIVSKWSKTSLTRAKNLLTDFINGACCS